MVAYQGDVAFEHAGSGGLGRMIKKAVSGEGTTLMKMSGSGEVFLADTAQDIHLIYLENDAITVNGSNLLAFDAGIDWDIKRVEGVSGMMGGGLFNTALKGTGWVAIISDGPPVLLNTGDAPTFADPQAAITWSSSVQTGIKTDIKLKNFIGRGSGESVQMSFSGAGWVLVQPSEGRVTAAAASGGGGRRRPAGPAGRLSPTLHFLKSCGNLANMADPSCPVCATADIICGKWTILVIRDLADGREPLLRARALARGHQPAHAVAAPARARGAGHRRAAHLPGGAAARGVLAHAEGRGARAADRGHAPLRARVPRRGRLRGDARRARRRLAPGRTRPRGAEIASACATVLSTTRCGTSRWRPPRS